MTIKTHGRMMTSDTIGITQLALQDGTANQAIVTDGQGVLRFATVGAGGSVGSSVYVEDIRSGDGTTATFTLSTAAPYEESILVFIDGVAQPTASFTLPSTTSITFTPAPGNGAAIRICHLGIASSVADCSITGAKICMGGDTVGDVLYFNGSAYQRLVIGSALQIFRTNAAMTAPEWVDATTATLPAVGADGNVLTSDGSNWSSEPTLGGVGGELVSHQFFTTEGTSTWTRPSGVKRIRVWVTGSGGRTGAIPVNGDTSNAFASGGGGSGATAMSVLDVSDLASATIVIGDNAATTTAGRNVTFAGTGITTLVGGGGIDGGNPNGPAGGSAAPGGGGVATGGQVNLGGQIGEQPHAVGTDSQIGGDGGHAPGPIGGTYGMGAKGAKSFAPPTTPVSGNSGCVFVEEYSDVSASLVGDSLVSTQFLTAASGTWTKPANVTKIEVFAVGGGGSSFSSGTHHSGGGGGAGTAYSILDVTNVATTSYAVAAAGTTTYFGDAGNTHFTRLSGQTGGTGGEGATPVGGAGGIATGGNAGNFTGQVGGAVTRAGQGSSWFGGHYGNGAAGAYSPSGGSVTTTGMAGCILVKEYSDASLVSGGSLVPAGAVNAYAGATAPAGWLLCYGQAISRTTYSTLFTAIGTTYGVGDGSTTFALPDMRGRAVAGQDDMGGTSANRLTTPINGDTLGAVGGIEASSHTHGRGASGVGFNPDDSGNLISATGVSTIQPTIILNYIIKT